VPGAGPGPEGHGEPGSHDALLEVGRVGRPHGLAGEVVVTSVSNRAERWVAGSRLVVELPDGSRRELEVATAAPVPSGGRWRVRFVGVGDRPGAEALRQGILLGAPMDDPDALWVHQLVGSAVEDGEGTLLGRVAAVVANPASDLLELDGGALIPLRFVVEEREGTLVVDLPPGLLDL
jgi:16S rRNA processing protein RimM